MNNIVRGSIYKDPKKDTRTETGEHTHTGSIAVALFPIICRHILAMTKTTMDDLRQSLYVFRTFQVFRFSNFPNHSGFWFHVYTNGIFINKHHSFAIAVILCIQKHNWDPLSFIVTRTTLKHGYYKFLQLAIYG